MSDLIDDKFDWGYGYRCWDTPTRCVIYECSQPMAPGLQMQLAYYGPWPIHNSRAQSGKEYLVCIGSEFGPPRTLVSIFSDQWMVYQQAASQPSSLSAERAAPVVAGADEWDWPYLVDNSFRLCASTEQDEADQEVDNWFAEEALKRNKLVDEARADSGETEFRASQCLRERWYAAQRADPALAKKISATTLESGYRRSEDGVLERRVSLPPPFGEKYVPVVPDGLAAALSLIHI